MKEPLRRVPLEEAVGLILAHDITRVEPGGRKGVLFPRGHRIREEDLPALAAVGKNHLYLYEPDPDLVQENDAARELGRALAGEGVTVGEPAEAKVQLLAARRGLWLPDRQRLLAVNRSEGVRVAALSGPRTVREGERLATLKVVPLFLPRSEIAGLSRGPIGRVVELRRLPVGIVITGSEVYTGLIRDGFSPVLRQKLAAFELPVLGETITPDDPSVIAEAILAFRERGAGLILVTGGLAVDPDDQTPGGITRAGAQILTHGVPVQPGSLLLLARLGETWIMGLPSSVIHDPVTSFDIFLPLILADLPIDSELIAGIGAAGLCERCSVCTFPNCAFGKW